MNDPPNHLPGGVAGFPEILPLLSIGGVLLRSGVKVHLIPSRGNTNASKPAAVAASFAKVPFWYRF